MVEMARANSEPRRPLALSNRRTLKRSEAIARDLAAHIVDERLPAGAMLPREQDMVEQLGVGRTTLREALRLLESRGVVTIRSGPGGGPVVRHPEPTDLTESLSLILQFQRATMLEVLEARIWLESAAARMAAPRVTKDELARLREANEEMRAADDADYVAIGEANARFHRVIASASGNIVIQMLVETLLNVSDHGASDLVHSGPVKRSSLKGHDLVIEALADHDAKAAEEAMRQHVHDGKERRLKQNPDLVGRPLRWIE